MRAVEGLRGVVVDGPNFSQMLRYLGVEHTYFPALNYLFRERIGASRKYVQPPRYTIPKDMCRSGRGLHDELTRAGFKPVPVTTFGERDDAVVTMMMCEYIVKARVASATLVTNDGEIVEGVLFAAARRFCAGDTNFRLHIVGSRVDNDDGFPMLGKETEKEINACKRFAHFHDFRDFVHKIAKHVQ